MAGGLQFDAGDLEEFRASLSTSSKALARELRRANKVVAATVATAAQARARGGTPLQRHFAAAITPRSTQEFGRIAVTGPRSEKGKYLANTAFFGTTKKIGWYAAAKYEGDPPQFPEWIGKWWDAGVAGEGPYVINDTIAGFRDRIGDLYMEAHERALKSAFPGGFS